MLPTNKTSRRLVIFTSKPLAVAAFFLGLIEYAKGCPLAGLWVGKNTQSVPEAIDNRLAGQLTAQFKFMQM